MKRLYACFACIAVLWCSCTYKTAAPSQEDKRRCITVSIEPLRYLAEQIAGDEFRIVTFVPKGSSPETYEPSPEQLVNLSGSLVYFGIGDLGFERTWLDRLRQTATETEFIDVSHGIQRLQGHEHGHGAAHRHTTDPHVWTSPANMKIIAQNICDALCRADTALAPTLQRNLCRTIGEIEAVDDSIRSMLGGVRQTTFLIYHPALTYFARDYGLHQLAIEKDGKEPSPGHLSEIVGACLTQRVKVIFVQQEFDRRNAELIARETGTRMEQINPLAYEWREEMLNIARKLHEP